MDFSNPTNKTPCYQIMGARLIILTFAYIAFNAVYGIVNIEWLGKQLTYSIWWLITGGIVSYIFFNLSNSVFSRDAKIALRILSYFTVIQSITSICSQYINVNEILYTFIVLIFFMITLIYWIYDRRRTKKSEMDR